MTNDEVIKIKVKKEYLERLKKMGISAQEVFSKGLEETLKLSLRKYIADNGLIDDLIEDDDEFDAFFHPEDKFGKFIISDEDIDNT